MADTTQITVRIPSELVEWIDGEVAAGRAASRASALGRIARRAQRKQQAERDMARLLSSRPEPADPDEEGRLEWMRDRQDWPDMGEPAGVLYPELIPTERRCSARAGDRLGSRLRSRTRRGQ